MSLRAGPYTFHHTSYDAAGDVLYAALTKPVRGSREPTPEHHVLRYDERGRFFGITFMSPREQLEREGGVFVSLPSGERVRVHGAERMIRAG